MRPVVEIAEPSLPARATVGLVETDAAGTILAATPAALDMLDGTGAEGDRLFARLETARPGLAATVAGLGRGESLRERVRLGGAALDLSVMRIASGYAVVLSDDRALSHAEDMAHREGARFAALADGLGSGAVFTLDRAGLVAGWSASAERQEGLTAAEASGLPLDLLLARCHIGVDAAAVLAEAERAGVATRCMTREADDGTRYAMDLVVRAVRRRDGALDGYVVTLRHPDGAAEREAELRRLADTDPLTGVLNRRAFDDAAALACALTRAQGRAFGAIVFDLDGFKRLNDRHGHAAGDSALRAMASTARRDLRAGDLIGRLGGDEFAIALPGADTALAGRIAERLRQSLAGIRMRRGNTALRFTASFGVAATTDAAESFDATLARADAALYRAKNAGRDRVASAA